MCIYGGYIFKIKNGDSLFDKRDSGMRGRCVLNWGFWGY